MGLRKTALGLAATAALAVFGIAGLAAPASADVTQDKTCTDATGAVWKGRVIWKPVYNNASGVPTVGVDYVGWTINREVVNTYSRVSTYDGNDTWIQTIEKQPVAFDYNAGTTYKTENPTDPKSVAGKYASIRATISAGTTAQGCTMEFIQPAVNPTATPSPTTTTTSPAPSPTTTTTSPAPSPTSTVIKPSAPVTVGSMLFSDEFNGTALDKNKWSECWYETATNVCGTMNESPTLKDHVSVSGGNLVLNQTGANEGALVSTGPKAGANTGFLFTTEGYAEARVLFPGTSTNCVNWPAWWTNGPASGYSDGEHDIAEAHSTGDIGTNYHYGNSQQLGFVDPAGSWCGTYHTYGLDRKATSADVYWDGVKVRSYATTDNLADHELIFNTGVWDSTSGRVTQYPAALKVDYVRVWGR